jgi:hypothetical protein
MNDTTALFWKPVPVSVTACDAPTGTLRAGSDDRGLPFTAKHAERWRCCRVRDDDVTGAKVAVPLTVTSSVSEVAEVRRRVHSHAGAENCYTSEETVAGHRDQLVHRPCRAPG